MPQKKRRKKNPPHIPKSYEMVPRFTYEPVRRTNTHDKRITRNDLSADQETALEELLRLLEYHEAPKTRIFGSRSPIVSLGGYAGTGKSTLIPIISRELADTSNTAFCAFTGKASNVIQRKLVAAGVDNAASISTIHRLIYKPLTNDDGRIVGWQRKSKPLFVEDEAQNRIPVKRIIIDEASMVGNTLLEDLLDYNIPILAVGDHGQLPPVLDKSVIAAPDVRLEHIHRQAADNPIIHLATTIRENGDIPKDYPSSDAIQFVPQDDMFEVIGETYERLGLDMAVLVRRNIVRKNLNTMPRETKEPVEGDLVICLKNAPPVFNGMRGIIRSIKPFGDHWYETVVFFPDDGLVVEGLLNRHQFGRDHTIESAYDLQREGIEYPSFVDGLGLQFDFGMALTVHKSQGSAFSEVVLYPERWSDDSNEDYRRWLYTAVTRAAEKLSISI